MRVVVVDPGYTSFDQETAILGTAGYTVEVYPGDQFDVAEKALFARGAAGLLVRWSEINEAFLEQVGPVRAIARYGVGYDNIDLGAAAARGVLVSNVQGYANHSVSDHALALILACVRGLRGGMANLRPGYSAAPDPHVPELHEMTLGIVGLGRIGGTLARKGQCLFRRVLACDPYVPASRFTETGAEALDLAALLAESDVVSLHCNLTEETRGIIDGAALARMRATAIIVNTARGPVMDEDALTAALEAGRVFAAGLDVFEDEPPGPNRDPLLAHQRVVATGHYAWYSSRASREVQRRAAVNLAAMLRGEVPEDCLNADAALHARAEEEAAG